MALNTSFAGRVYSPSTPYLVGREKIRDFATAVGSTSPVCHDLEAARALGYADVVASPTFAVIVAQRAEAAFIADPEAGIDFSRVVHADERFTHFSPIVAGDLLQAVVHVVTVTERAGISMVTTRAEISRILSGEGTDSPELEEVCHVTSSLVIRGAN